MFVETWRRHWGLTRDPFACEDADKDVVLSRTDARAVHSGFDRLFGDPDSPAPGIVFGEKGSGKSSLRLAMRRRLDGRAHEDGRHVFWTEYAEFDGFLESFRRAVGAGADPAEIGAAVRERWTTADHLDALLSLGTTKLVDELLEEEAAIDARALTRKQRTDLLVLATLYLDSRRRTRMESLRRLRGVLGLHRPRAALLTTLRVLLSLVAIAIALAPYLGPPLGLDPPGPPTAWLATGGALLVLVWLQAAVAELRLRSAARKASDGIRVLRRDAAPLARVLRSLPATERRELPMPRGTDEGTRYELLGRLRALLSASGYGSWYVLLDRVDEPSTLNADPEGARRFVETLLDHKLLQMPGIALKLFLPIELDGIYRDAPPEKLKRMRLDKSNLVPTLEWTGQELLEIARARLRAASEPEREGRDLQEFLGPDVDHAHVRDTLETLGTPRYALGFLSSLFTEHARNLPEDLPEEAPEWRVPREQLEVVRASWVERTRLLRRKLN